MPTPKKNEEKNDYLKRCTVEVSAEGLSNDQAFAVCNRYWDDAKNQRSALSLHAPLKLAKNADGEAKSGEFLVVAYTGQIIELGWWGRYIFSLEGMKFAQKMPVLREHARDRIVGNSTKTWIDGQNLLLSGKFSTKTQDGKEVSDLAIDGFPWQASVGIAPKKIKILDTDKETAVVNGQEVRGPLEIWVESKVNEVSICALGADDQTAAIGLNLAELDKAPVSIERAEKKQEAKTMPITLEQLQAEAPALLDEIQTAARDGGFQAGREAGVQEERQRVLKIVEANGDRELTLAGITDGTSAVDAVVKIALAKDDFKAKKLAEMHEQAPESLGQGVSADDGKSKLLSADAKAICKNLGITEEQFLAGKTYLAKRGE